MVARGTFVLLEMECKLLARMVLGIPVTADLQSNGAKINRSCYFLLELFSINSLKNIQTIR